MRCKCGRCHAHAHLAKCMHESVWHTRADCGPELLWEGATCRGAAGRWEAWWVGFPTNVPAILQAVSLPEMKAWCHIDPLPAGYVVEFRLVESTEAES